MYKETYFCEGVAYKHFQNLDVKPQSGVSNGRNMSEHNTFISSY
jgi:hypothetical protein